MIDRFEREITVAGDDLTDEQRAKLLEIAERKKDKQGKYVDRPEALLAVAQRRADAVKAYMRGKGATDRQLRRCRPALDPQADAKPRVDIKF